MEMYMPQPCNISCFIKSGHSHLSLLQDFTVALALRFWVLVIIPVLKMQIQNSWIKLYTFSARLLSIVTVDALMEDNKFYTIFSFLLIYSQGVLWARRLQSSYHSFDQEKQMFEPYCLAFPNTSLRKLISLQIHLTDEEKTISD